MLSAAITDYQSFVPLVHSPHSLQCYWASDPVQIYASMKNDIKTNTFLPKVIYHI